MQNVIVHSVGNISLCVHALGDLGCKLMNADVNSWRHNLLWEFTDEIHFTEIKFLNPNSYKLSIPISMQNVNYEIQLNMFGTNSSPRNVSFAIMCN